MFYKNDIKNGIYVRDLAAWKQRATSNNFKNTFFFRFFSLEWRERVNWE